MSFLFAKGETVDQVARAERAALDKASMASQLGPHPAPPDVTGRLDMAMQLIESEVYENAEFKGRIDPWTILRVRDSCYGVLYRGISNAQMTEALALQTYKEACTVEAEQLVRQPTAGAALCRERLRAIFPKEQAFGGGTPF